MREISQGIIEWWEFNGLTRGTDVDFGLLLQTGESVGLEFRSCPYCQSLRPCSLMLAMSNNLWNGHHLLYILRNGKGLLMPWKGFTTKKMLWRRSGSWRVLMMGILSLIFYGGFTVEVRENERVVDLEWGLRQSYVLLVNPFYAILDDFCFLVQLLCLSYILFTFICFSKWIVCYLLVELLSECAICCWLLFALPSELCVSFLVSLCHCSCASLKCDIQDAFPGYL